MSRYSGVMISCIAPLSMIACLLIVSIEAGATLAFAQGDSVTKENASSTTESADAKVDDSEVAAKSTVGMPTQMSDFIIPGGEVRVKPMSDIDQAIVVRITNAIPHGDSYRYEMTWYGLDEGAFNLAEYLERVDEEAQAIPAIPIKVMSILESGQVKPNQLSSGRRIRVGGYLLIGIGLAVLWLVVLLALLLAGRKKHRTSAGNQQVRLTVADQLRPLVQSAMRGDLSDSERSRLERVLLAFWRKRLGVEQASPSEAMAALRADNQAGALVRQLEDWLHRPDPPGKVDVEALLAPYARVTDASPQA